MLKKPSRSDFEAAERVIEFVSLDCDGVLEIRYLPPETDYRQLYMIVAFAKTTTGETLQEAVENFMNDTDRERGTHDTQTTGRVTPDDARTNG